MKKYILPLLLIGVLAISCTSNRSATENAKTVSPDSLLIPGQAAGRITLGQDAQPLYTTMGQPTSGDAAMQKAVATWQLNGNPGTSISIYTARDTGENPVARVMQVRVSDPGFKTSEGLSMGSTLQDVMNTYPVKKIKTGETRETEIYNNTGGIAFEFNKAGICTAIIIHPKGELEGTYLLF